MPTLTKPKPKKPTAIKFNGFGVATQNVHRQKPSMPPSCSLRVEIDPNTRAAAVVLPKASAAERKKALRDYRNARQTLQRGWQDLGETAIRVQETGAWADEGKANFEEWIVAERGHSVVRQAMLAIRQRTRFLPIAKRYDLPIDPDVQDHFRALPAKINGEPITDTDLVAIAEQTKKLMKHDVPLTGKLIREAVKLTQMDGDELAAYKREQRQDKHREREARVLPTSDLRPPTSLPEPPAETALRSAPAETASGDQPSQPIHPPLGINLDFNAALDEFRDYARALANRFKSGARKQRLVDALEALATEIAMEVPHG